LNLPDIYPLQSKKYLITRLIIVVAVTFVLTELAEFFGSRYNLPHAELIKEILLIGSLSLLIFHLLAKPMLREISSRMKVEAQLRRSETANRALLNALPDTLLRVSATGDLIDYRFESANIMHLGIGKNISDIFPAAIAQDILSCLEITLNDGELQKLEVVLSDWPDEHHHELRIVKSGNDEVLIIISDIDDRKRYEEKLKYFCTHDVLTGLHNRAFYETQMDRLEKGRQYPLGVIVIDLDGLKETNDTYGHAAGDKMICKAAHVLKKVFRAGDLVSRTGGDEFTILTTETDHSSLQLVINRIHACLDEVNKADPEFVLGFSLGAAIAETKETFHEAIKLADLRMYEEKSLHKAANP